jgi:hypothetical protein
MVFVYIRIYFAARARARRAVRKPPKPKAAPAPIEIEDRHPVSHRQSSNPVPQTPTVKVGVSSGHSSALLMTATQQRPPPPHPSSESAKSHHRPPLSPLTDVSPGSGGGGGGSGLGGSIPPSLPTTPDGRTVKQVGFQDPLETRPHEVVKPEITVESYSAPTQQQKHTKRTSVSESSEANNTRNGKNGGDDGVVESNDAQHKIPKDEPKGDRTIVESECPTPEINSVTSGVVGAIRTGSASEGETKVLQSDSSGLSPTTTSPDLKISDKRVEAAGAATTSNECNSGKDSPPSPPSALERIAASRSVQATTTFVLRHIEMEDEPGPGDDDDDGGFGTQPLVPTVHLKQEPPHLTDANLGQVIQVPGGSSSSTSHPPQQHQSSSSTLAVRELESAISELQSNGGSSRDEVSTGLSSQPGSKRSKRTKLHFLRVETPMIWRTSSSLSLNGDVHILGTLSRSCSRLQLDMDPVSDVEPSSSDSGAVSRCAVVKPLKLRLCQPFFGKKSASASNKARRDVLDMGKLPSPKVSFTHHHPSQIDIFLFSFFLCLNVRICSHTYILLHGSSICYYN